MATLAQESTWIDRDQVTGTYARKVLHYADSIKRLVQRAEEPGFDASAWDDTAAIVDAEAVKRVGNDKAAMSWQVYTAPEPMGHHHRLLGRLPPGQRSRPAGYIWK